jgi:hypothetical protein
MTKRTFIPTTAESRQAWGESNSRNATAASVRVCQACGEFANVDPGYSTGTCTCGAIVS